MARIIINIEDDNSGTTGAKARAHTLNILDAPQCLQAHTFQPADTLTTDLKKRLHYE